MCHEVTDHEGPLGYTPEALSYLEIRQLSTLGRGEAEDFGRVRGLRSLLLVDDLRGAVGEESLGESPGLGVGAPDRVEVGEPVDDHEVGDAESA